LGEGNEEELAVRRIIEANIKRLKEMLKAEADPTKRAMEERLLAEEEEKLKQVNPSDNEAF
jgi:bacterioferritin (cytochrome b1)